MCTGFECGTHAKRYSFGMENEASAIESAVKQTIRDGFRSGDISSEVESVGTIEMGEAIIESLPA